MTWYVAVFSILNLWRQFYYTVPWGSIMHPMSDRICWKTAVMLASILSLLYQKMAVCKRWTPIQMKIALLSHDGCIVWRKREKCIDPSYCLSYQKQSFSILDLKCSNTTQLYYLPVWKLLLRVLNILDLFDIFFSEANNSMVYRLTILTIAQDRLQHPLAIFVWRYNHERNG